MRYPDFRKRISFLSVACTLCLIATLPVFALGKLLGDLNVVLCGTLLLFAGSTFFCLNRPRRRCISLFFYIAFAVFLLSRPTISMLRGSVWWYYSAESATFALNLMYISLLTMQLGLFLSEAVLEKLGYYRHEAMPAPPISGIIRNRAARSRSRFQTALQNVAFAGFLITVAFSIVTGLETMMYARATAYAEVYAGSYSTLPSIFSTLASLAPYFLCLFLATLPTKRYSTFALGLYVLSTVPILLAGARNSIALALIFSLLYFVFRDYLDNTKYWVGRFEKSLLIIACPLAIAFLGAYNYLREGMAYSGSFSATIVDFFYKQGVSFDVLCLAYKGIPQLPQEVSHVYTFGPFIDYFAHGSIAQILFGAVSLGSGNSVLKATYGNTFAHSLAYVIEPNYLNGHGCGSSYLLETFADFGYTGVFLFSLLLAMLVSILLPLFKTKGVVPKTLVLCSLTSFFMIPRAEATGWLLFIVTLQFWLVLALSYLMAGLCSKSYICAANETKKKEGINSMFERCGFMDVLHAIYKKKWLVLAATVVFMVAGAGYSLMHSSSVSSEKAGKWTVSSSYLVTDTGTSDALDRSTMMAETVLKITKADFTREKVYTQMLKKYSAADMIKAFNLPVEEENFTSFSLATVLNGNVQSATNMVNIFVSSTNKQLATDYMQECRTLLEASASDVGNCSITYLGGITSPSADAQPTAQSDTSLAKTILKFAILGLVLSIMVVAVMALFKPTINRRSDFALYDVPVLGEVRLSSKGNKQSRLKNSLEFNAGLFFEALKKEGIKTCAVATTARNSQAERELCRKLADAGTNGGVPVNSALTGKEDAADAPTLVFCADILRDIQAEQSCAKCQAVVFVETYGKTGHKEFDEALDVLRVQKVPVIGVLSLIG